MQIISPRSINLLWSPLPREKTESSKRTQLPERSLGHGNYAPKYKDGAVVADLDFVHYRKATNDRPPDLIHLQNYSNYQSICLA